MRRCLTGLGFVVVVAGVWMARRRGEMKNDEVKLALEQTIRAERYCRLF